MHDVEIAQKFATRNREIIANHIISKMGWKVVDQFETAHNYIDTEDMILRKGAVSAKAGERLLVPLNMRDGCVICVGKGVPEANYSCNHGAGRQLSRSAARANLSLDDFIEAMEGVYTTSVSEATLDEAPDAYKDSDVILNDMLHLVNIEKRLYTIYNFKGGQE
jgi:RNA-splicing ligase RtcB